MKKCCTLDVLKMYGYVAAGCLGRAFFHSRKRETNLIMSASRRHSSLNRRALYRCAKKLLSKSLRRRWMGSRASLDRRVRSFLRDKDRSYLLRLVRRQAFAVMVAGVLLAGSFAHAEVPINVADIRGGTGGFAVFGDFSNDQSGWSVSGAGDVNGDGLADVVIGAPRADGNDYQSTVGESYVVFGKASGTLTQLSDVIAGTGGFVINGDDAFGYSGWSVSGAGDVNGDGLDDIIIGAPRADTTYYHTGESYVVFGKANGTPVNISDVMAGSGGFAINGISQWDRSGWTVSAAGDVNGDGLADIVIGAQNNYYYYNSTRSSYVVFGKANGSTVQLSNIVSGVGGFVISGLNQFNYYGNSVSGAGDVNGDGLDDLVLGASRADPGSVIDAGESYVVFGKAGGAAVDLANVRGGVGGFVINGIDQSDQSGWSVSGAGDVNGDGLADVIVGAPFAGEYSEVYSYAYDSGESYVVFG